MSREDLVQQVADLIRREFVEDHEEVTANAILDEILPQVATVTELEALPVGTILVSSVGSTWQVQKSGERKFARNMSDGHRWLFSSRLYTADPLTVVWQPS